MGVRWELRRWGRPTSKAADVEIPTARSPPLLFSVSTSPLFSSNPRPLKTSRRPPLIMTRLSNPIAVAQTQGSALNPLVSDCFSRVKWLCPPCHSPGHRHRRRWDESPHTGLVNPFTPFTLTSCMQWGKGLHKKIQQCWLNDRLPRLFLRENKLNMRDFLVIVNNAKMSCKIKEFCVLLLFYYKLSNGRHFEILGAVWSPPSRQISNYIVFILKHATAK